MRRPSPWVGLATQDVVRTVILSPDTLFAETLSLCLTSEEGIEVVGLARDSATAEQAVDDLSPAVLLTDQRAVGPDLLARLAQARRVEVAPRSVLVTTVSHGTRAETMSFDAVVPPQSSLDLVIATVRGVGWYRHARPSADTDGAAGLSERELEVLRLLAEGVATNAIASRLHLSHHTVRNHVRRITAKLHVSSRGQAVSEGRRLGLL